ALPNPEYGLALSAFRRAQAAHDGGREDEARAGLAEAERRLRLAIERSPTYVKARAQLAYVLHLAGRDAEALEQVERVLALADSGRDRELALQTKMMIERPQRK